MCLPFLCGDRPEDHGPGAQDHDKRQSTPASHPLPPDHGDGYPYQPTTVASSSPLNGGNHGYGIGNNGAGNNGTNHGYDVGKNGAGKAKQEPAAAGVTMNGEHGAGFYTSDSDHASVGFVPGRKGAVEKIPPPPSPTWGAPARKSETNMAASTTALQTPEYEEHVAAGARHHAPVAASSQPKEGATDTTQTAPVRQVARRDDEGDDDSAAGASSYSSWK